MTNQNKSEDRKCPSCQRKIVDERDEHWNERLICAYCCAKAHNCRRCRSNVT